MSYEQTTTASTIRCQPGCHGWRRQVEFKIAVDCKTQRPAAVIESTPRRRVIGHAHAVGRKAGFVRVDADRTLTVPDFLGSLFFNTWGNMAVNARAGLLFLDFEKGDVLPLAVTADILWEDAEVAHFAGARRLLRLSVRETRRIAASLPLRWGPVALLLLSQPVCGSGASVRCCRCRSPAR